MKSLVEKVANAMNKTKESAFLGENVVLNQAKVQERNIESAQNAAEKWDKEIAQIAQVAHNQSGFDVQIGQWDADGLDELIRAKENEKKNLRKALADELKAALNDDFVLNNIRKKSIKNSAKKLAFGEAAEIKIANLIKSNKVDLAEFGVDSSLRASHSALNDKTKVSVKTSASREVSVKMEIIGSSPIMTNNGIMTNSATITNSATMIDQKSALNDKKRALNDEKITRHSNSPFCYPESSICHSERSEESNAAISCLDSIGLNSILLEIEESAQIRLLNGTADDKKALDEAENIIKKVIKAQNKEQADFLCLCRAANAKRLETITNALISQSERLLCFKPQNPKTANYFIASAREFCAALYLLNTRTKDFVQNTLEAYAPLLFEKDIESDLDSMHSILNEAQKAELKNALITIAAFYQRKSGYNSDIAELSSNLHISHSGVNELLGGGLCISAEISLNDRISEFCLKNLFSKDELEICANSLEIALESDYYKDDEIGFVSALAAVNSSFGFANLQEWEITASLRDEQSLEFNSTILCGERLCSGFSEKDISANNEIFALNKIISNDEIFALENLKLGLDLAEYSQNMGAICGSYILGLKNVNNAPKCVLQYSINGENSELDIICRDIFEKIEQKIAERKMQKAA